MITMKDGIFSLETANTGYYMALRGSVVENLHYGARIAANKEALCEKLSVGYGYDTVYRPGEVGVSLEQLCLELSSQQKGDFRTPVLTAVMPNGGRTLELCFAAARQLTGSVPPQNLPAAYGGAETLALDFTSPEGAMVTLFYTVYPDCDVITRRLAVRAGTAGSLTLERALSYQLDLPRADYTLSTFTGAWARERHETRLSLAPGTQLFGSRTGTSGSFCNPFFMLAQNEATEFHGDVYGFNLIYSGSHLGTVEVSPYGRTRVAAGIQPEGFAWTLAPGETFETPEAVLCFSAAGKNGMSAAMHTFVQKHIVRSRWADRERPVLINNWEATYFDFTEAKLLQIAKTAAKLGMELFVLDDGWFGARNGDTAGLGDYAVNRKKLPDGLDGLARKLRGLGLSFGLWVEPEMCNADSDLYRAHPDWVVCTPGVTPTEGRNQLVLDLCRPEVQDYIIENVNAVLASADIRYLKWDMNRNLTDNYSSALSEQGRFAHTFAMGVYRVMREVTLANPDVLFEGCAGGGNRFDLGVLTCMPQIWTSDDTDACERQYIQHGTSYGYPPSVISCHVSASPNHQTARATPLESRFDAAAFGVLGYELDLTRLSSAEKKAVAAQVAWYKERRALLQFGRFVRVEPPARAGRCVWMTVSPDGKTAVAGEMMQMALPNTPTPPLRLAALNPDDVYEMTVRPQVISIKAFGSLINHVSPVKVNAEGLLVHKVAEYYMLPCEEEHYTVSGSLLLHAGVRQKQRFGGAGYSAEMRLMPDFSARLYTLRAQTENLPEKEENSL